MKDQLEFLMNYYKLTPARFAEKIGVQRSSISHIISGRNKPSYDFILKLLETFDEIDAEWLLLKKGNALKTQKTPNQIPPKGLFNTNIGNIVKSEPAIEYKSKQTKEAKKEKMGITSVNNIETVLLLSSNGTFKIYTNE